MADIIMLDSSANMTSAAEGNLSGSVFYWPLCPPGPPPNDSELDCVEERAIFDLTEEYSHFNKPILGYITPFLVFITIIINLVVCIVLMKRNMRTPTNCLLVAMAISDMLTGVWALPICIYFYMLGHDTDYVPYDWCYPYFVFNEYLPTIFHTASIWLTVALAFQRYIYVCHTAKAKQWCTIPNVIKVIIGVYVAAIFSQVTRFFELNLPPYPAPSLVHPNTTIVGCLNNFAPFVIEHTYLYFNFYYWFRVVFIHLVPCTSLVILNSLLIMAMKQAQSRRQMLLKLNRKTECRRMKDSNCTTLMLVAVVGLFLLVEFPLGILLMLLVVDNTFDLSIMADGTKVNATLFINFFILLSYPLNFFIYCGMSRQFRETFKRLFVSGAAPMDREHSNYISLATENGTLTSAKTGITKDTAM